jgi:hypothetical protein
MSYTECVNTKLQEVADKHSLTLEQVSNLRRAMEVTWSQIYGDLMDCFEGGEDEAYSLYDDEASMIAENTIDADRVTTFCPDMDLGWVYKLEDGSHRLNCIEMAEDILRAACA